MLPRQDEANSRGVELNLKLSEEIESQEDERLAFVDYSASFHDPFFFRFKFTQKDEFPDPVHLSDEGVVRLQELIRVEIHRREQMVLKNSQSPLAEDEWNGMRQSTFNMREPTRFKVTNYAPDTDSNLILKFSAKKNPKQILTRKTEWKKTEQFLLSLWIALEAYERYKQTMENERNNNLEAEAEKALELQKLKTEAQMDQQETAFSTDN